MPWLCSDRAATHLRENLPLPLGLLLRPESSWYVACTATALRLLGAAGQEHQRTGATTGQQKHESVSGGWLGGHEPECYAVLPTALDCLGVWLDRAVSSVAVKCCKHAPRGPLQQHCVGGTPSGPLQAPGAMPTGAQGCNSRFLMLLRRNWATQQLLPVMWSCCCCQGRHCCWQPGAPA
jgi:hypothetical protein